MRNYRFQPPAEPLHPSQPAARRRLSWSRLAAGMIPPIFAGSGLLVLFSLISGSSPGKPLAWLRERFPSEAGSALPIMQLLLGLALVLTAVHLWGRKKRALHLAVGLALASSLLSFAGRSAA